MLDLERPEGSWVVALAGNPNVGKSTVFNALTGLRQHTGNWPGKTVEIAQGRYVHGSEEVLLVDLPGTYSLLAHSAEEEVARDFLAFGQADAVVVVCDATCLGRNLNLAMQVLELHERVVVCVNLLDEAKRKGILLDLNVLGKELGVPVVGLSARTGEGLEDLKDKVCQVIGQKQGHGYSVVYDHALEENVAELLSDLSGHGLTERQARWAALRALEGDPGALGAMKAHWGVEISGRVAGEGVRERLVTGLYKEAEILAGQVVRQKDRAAWERQLSRDRLLTHPWVGVPLMILLLAGVLWLTLVGANGPSAWLSNRLLGLQVPLRDLLSAVGAADWLCGMLVDGVYCVLAWVVSVMLPPMAIFFPLFTLLEDLGYLPRVAFNLDRPFQRCHACGKQALTMCMGFGCNAVGVVGCRIIDSPRERLIAMLTNTFVPCNGRFPTLLTMISVFFITGSGVGASFGAALLLTGFILLSFGVTFATSRLLAATCLKGEASSFVLELPPFRKPDIGQILVRSFLDRTVFVLRRAVLVAAPAGLLVWLMTHVTLGGSSLLAHCAQGIAPFARVFGLDGVILMAFILGMPANEIVLPILLMAYLGQGSLQEAGSLATLREILVAQGWNGWTALCMMLFSLFHWPCATTLLTIRKESGSWKWMALAFALPTGIALGLCFLTANGARLLGLW